MSKELTDQHLFKLIAHGDEAAFAELFRRYDKRIYPFVYKMIKDKSVAEEAIQEIFIKIWNNREKLSFINFPEAYIMTIAYNHTLDQIKKQLNENKMLSGFTQRQVNVHNNTEEAMQLKDSITLIQEAVNKLPPQQRTVYELSREQGMKYDEIAEQLNISANTVRNHLVKALQSIRETIQDNNALPISLLTSLLLLALIKFK